MVDQAEILNYARRYKGVKFHHLGRGMFGIDCIGLLVVPLKHFDISDFDQKVYSRQPDGHSLLKVLRSLDFLTEIPVEDRQPADLGVLWINSPKLPRHFAWLTEDGLIHTHCRRGGGKVIEHAFDDFWTERLCNVFRIKGIE